MPTNKDKRLRIALLNSTDCAGGAETVVRLLRDGLYGRGHDTVLWVGRRRGKGDEERTHELPCSPSERRVGQRYASKGFFNLGLPSSLNFCSSSALSGVDLVHLHNLHGHYFSITALPSLAERVPLVWTFHDFFPMTGGCAFPFQCERWKEKCGSCPQLGQYPIATKFDRTRRMQSIKRRTFRDLPVTIITPSNHLARAVVQSGVFAGAAADMRIIPYGVDTRMFHPNRQHARQRLGLPTDPAAPGVVLVVAQGLDDPRKGIDLALTALSRTAMENLTVMVAGLGNAKPFADALSRHNVLSFGYVTDREEMALLYAAADLFLFTSLAENFPCVVMEAMASGTAVLAFDINGLNEQIVPDRTGFLVPVGDTDSLARATGRLLRNIPRLQAVGEAARRHAETHWSLEQFLDRHEHLYGELLAQIPRNVGTGSRSTGVIQPARA